MSMDDDMRDYLMDVKTPKEAWETFVGMFVMKSKPIENNVWYQCGELGHIAWECKVKMIIIKENSATDDSRYEEASK